MYQYQSIYAKTFEIVCDTYSRDNDSNNIKILTVYNLCYATFLNI